LALGELPPSLKWGPFPKMGPLIWRLGVKFWKKAPQKERGFGNHPFTLGVGNQPGIIWELEINQGVPTNK